MYIGEWQYFWWNNVTGPHKAVVGVAEALLSNSTVILKVPADLPWRRPMRSAIEEQIRNMSDTFIEHNGLNVLGFHKVDLFVQFYNKEASFNRSTFIALTELQPL